MNVGAKGALFISMLAATAAASPETVAQHQLTTNVVSDPTAAVFVYEDVENFVRAMERLSSNADTVAVLQAEYFGKATPGLQMFVQKYNLTPERLLKAMHTYPQKYSSLHKSLAALRSSEPSYRATYSKLKEEITTAVFPPTYFLVGAHRGIGSGSVEGPLISIEKKTIESIKKDPSATLVHEMVHMQQLAALGEAYFAIFSGEEKTLLALSVREGVATYFAERVAGGSVHKNQARDYLLQHEADLWQSFRPKMLGNETGEWLWSTPSNPEQPRDIGYALGARIVQAYYERARDKHEAVQEILAITDYAAFLARSGYEEGLALAESPLAVRLSPDFASARAILQIYRQGSVDTAEMDRLLAMQGVQAVLKQALRFSDDATESEFQKGLRMSVAGKEVPQPDHFQFNRIRTNIAGIEETMAWIENHTHELTAGILGLISPYSPVSEPVDVRFFLVVGGNSDGWTRNGVFHTALQYFGDDVEGMLILLSHELYHVVQEEFMGPLVHKEDTQEGRAEQLLQNTITEGTASYVADPLKIQDGGSYTEWYSKKYLRNLNHLELNFDLLETLVFRAYHDSDVPLRDLYNIGFSGALESPVYFVGYAMAREIERVSGRDALLELVQEPSAKFFGHYAAIAAREDASAIQFSLGFRDILKAVQARTAK